MIEFQIFDKRIYLNPKNGDVSFNLKEIENNEYAINITDFLNNYKPNAYTFCLSISNACNLNCKYCFNKRKNGTLLEFKTIKKELDFLFDTFNDGEKYFVDLSGFGEPLLNLNCIVDIAKYCIEKSNNIRKEIIPMLSTNGLLLTPNIAMKLQDLQVLFGISIDGNEQNNDLNRITSKGEPTFQKIINNISNIKNREFIGMTCTLTNNVFNIVNSIDEMKKYFKTLSYRFVRDDLLGLDNEATIKWIEQYDHLAIKLLNEIRREDFSTIFALINGDDYFGRYLYKMFGNFRTLNRCDAGISRFSFVKDDLFCGCSAQSIDQKFYYNKDEIKQLQKNKLEEQCNDCKDCNYKLYCGGKCPIIKDNIENKNYQCNINKHLIQLAAYLKLMILSENIDSYKIIYDFCIEKRNRYKIDEDFNNYLLKHSYLSFIEAKIEYDKIKNRIKY